ncbi:uncharacterized protein LOC134812492 [Bolinopsis microptera]|uniref:uncharacterized protein LOC134812492 n=1 Tax=Bolinopsis microptera TaxID=2820187 RepID=UPI003078D347
MSRKRERPKSAGITSFFKPVSSQSSVETIYVQPDSDRVTTTAGVKPTISSCGLNCCQLESANPTRLHIPKADTLKEYGKGDKKRKRNFITEWLTTYPWLVLCKSAKKAFCQTCRYSLSIHLVAISEGGRGQDTFFKSGFSDWKDGIRHLDTHQKSEVHRESCDKLRLLKYGTPITQIFSKANQEMYDRMRRCLLEQIDAVIHHARANIPMRNKDEAEGNLQQYPKVTGLKEYWTETTPRLRLPTISSSYSTVRRSTCSSLESNQQNIMALSLMKLGTYLEWNSFRLYCDGLRTIIRSTKVEDLLGLHQADKTDAESLLAILESVFLSHSLDFQSLRGQTYDGAAVLQGAHSGVGVRILAKNPNAMLTHCLNHNTNLVLQEAATLIPHCTGPVQ